MISPGQQARSALEQDATTRWRRVLKWRQGERATIKRMMRRRMRRTQKRADRVSSAE